jgi:endonuclease/exonuclease/phosphatase family metal-dependent hydrolase
LAGTDPPAELFTRHWGRALLETPSGRRLALHSLHTIAADADVRSLEVERVAQAICADLDAGHPVILQGDLNHTPHDPVAAVWTAAGLTDTFLSAPGVEDEGKTLLRPQPRARLDYVLASGSVARLIVSCRPLNEERFRLYPDRPDAISLSDHLPVLAEFQGL